MGVLKRGRHQGVGNSLDWSIVVHDFASICSIFLVPLRNKLHRSQSLVNCVSGVLFSHFRSVTDTFVHQAWVPRRVLLFLETDSRADTSHNQKKDFVRLLSTRTVCAKSCGKILHTFVGFCLLQARFCTQMKSPW